MGINQIQTGRFNRLVQKLFSIKGPANLSEVGAEILPILPIRIGNEIRFFEGWGRFGQAVVLGAGGAGNISAFRLRNPSGSNVIAVVEKILVSNSGAATDTAESLFHGAVATDLGTINAGVAQRFDARGTAIGSLILSSQNNAVLTSFGSNKLIYTLAANQNFDLIIKESEEIPLLPGDAVGIAAGVANNGLTAAIWWRERSMEESELK
jgi:hypothetical protein